MRQFIVPRGATIILDSGTKPLHLGKLYVEFFTAMKESKGSTTHYILSSIEDARLEEVEGNPHLYRARPKLHFDLTHTVTVEVEVSDTSIHLSDTELNYDGLVLESVTIAENEGKWYMPSSL